ncbi:hypothetical protein B0T10DRAFT_417737 [Thelonectria olida]|uniref:Uncharacterized protein n=1 Tax=Thelonectria olida TaxID=1576542 RepID=A0A9P9AHD3_9HYPO|nr:hypothetical protein B0T10DRAFT_417737 [Thelonectria olida]
MAKKQKSWSPEEDARLIRLRQGNRRWEDISQQLPGRSALACRHRYRNHLKTINPSGEEIKDASYQSSIHWELGIQDMHGRSKANIYITFTPRPPVAPKSTAWS